MAEDLVMGLCELSNDLFYRSIPQEKILYYLMNALEEGKQDARELSGNDIYELYDRFQISIDIREKSGHAFGVLLRAQAIMSEKESRVELYEESIAALAQQSGSDCRQELTYDLAVKIHLAHELFHFIEYRRKQTVSQKLDTVQTFKLLGFKRKAHIQSSSEIAAHAFAKHLLNLPVLPNYFDYQYLIDIGKLSQQERNNQLMEYKMHLSRLFELSKEPRKKSIGQGNDTGGDHTLILADIVSARYDKDCYNEALYPKLTEMIPVLNFNDIGHHDHQEHIFLESCGTYRRNVYYEKPNPT